MTQRRLWMVAVLLATGCDGGTAGEPDAADGRGDAEAEADADTDAEADAPPPCEPPEECWGPVRDLGGTIPGATTASSLAPVGDAVFVGTDNGVYRHALDGTGDWMHLGLEGLLVLVLRARPSDGLLVAGLEGDSQPVRVSGDGGATWQAFGTELGDGVMTDPVHDVVFVGDAILADTAANSLARSTDDGRTWTYVLGFPGAFGYSCYIGLDGDSLLQGCELPLDDAWIDRLPLTPTGVGEPTRIVDITTISNRRPNAIVSSPDFPGRAWAGLEGALIWIEGSEWDWIHRAEADEPEDYVYVRGVWVDPADRRHLVYGGFNTGPFALYETFDDGATHVRLPSPEGVDPGPGGLVWRIEHLTATGDDRRTVAMAVTVGDLTLGPTTARVFVRAPL